MNSVDNVPIILFVDDEESVLKALQRVFRREGYHLLTAGSGPEALDILAQDKPDVVISDFRMPEMNGTELLREVSSVKTPGCRSPL